MGDALSPPVVLLDNGSYKIKAGLYSACESKNELQPTVWVYNSIVKDKLNRLYVGNEFDRCLDKTNLSFWKCHEMGYLVNLRREAEIWEHVFGSKGLKIEPSECSLFMTETPLTPASLQADADELVFEYFQFRGQCRASAPVASLFHWYHEAWRGPRGGKKKVHNKNLNGLVVDIGHGHVHIVPVYHGKPIRDAVRRHSVGGHWLTSFLRNLLSERQFNLESETYTVCDIKEKLCHTWEPPTVGCAFDPADSTPGYYELPDGVKLLQGQALSNSEFTARRNSAMESLRVAMAAGSGGALDATKFSQPILTLKGERTIIPEALFQPSLVYGLQQGGIVQAIHESVSACPETVQPLLYGNVLLAGGSSKFAGLPDRLRTELRAVAPLEYPVKVRLSDDPELCAWRGMNDFVQYHRSEFDKIHVSKAFYEEHGSIHHREQSPYLL